MQAYKAMPETFNLLSLVSMARSFMARPFCTDGTITRRLRELRNEFPEIYGYRVIDPENAKYQKETPKKMAV